MLGELLLPLRWTPLYNGSPVASGQLQFFRSGTTTEQNTYSDSDLSTPNNNPIDLDSSGTLTTKVYGDPSSGFDYSVRLLTAAGSILWTEDDVVVPSRDVATIVEGSFVATLTGMDATTTGTFNYRIIADDEGTGKLCTLLAPAAVIGTSNTTDMTMTGLPAACVPQENAVVGTFAVDSGGGVVALAEIPDGSSTITFYVDQPFSATGFTGSSTKGLSLGWSITYPL